MGYKVFTPTVLSSADVNDFLMKQTVMVFASSTARAASLTAPTNGMITYLTDSNALFTYNGSAWVAVGGTAVTSATGTANQITVSASTGAVTFSLPSAVTIATLNSTTTNATTLNATTANTANVVNSSNITSAGYIAAGGTGVTDAGSVSTNNWFRATGNTGLYFQTHGGGFHMTDSTWVRTYNSKNLYTAGETRTNGSFSSDQSRQRGSYGDITVGSNGRQGGWGGIEFVSPEDQTFMVYTDQHSGMYRNNTTWNWLWNYSTLQVPSDERYKREIEPLGLGMKFIEQLNPVSFLRVTEREDDDPDATEAGYYYGFTAQNVRAALDVCGETRDIKMHDIGGPNMGLVACVEGAVYDRQFIGITEFIAPLVEAIKELNVRLTALESV